MAPYISNGTIYIKSELGIEYAVCNITYIVNQDETYKYIFKPNYNVIELMPKGFFQGIPGLNLDLKKEEYIRENIIPVFIAERVPSKHREDLYELLEQVDLDFIEPILYLKRTPLQYFGDKLYVKDIHQKAEIKIDLVSSKLNNQGIIKLILRHLSLGDDILLDTIKINDSNRKFTHDLLLKLYSRSYKLNKELTQKGIDAAKANHLYRGRKKKEINVQTFKTLLAKINNKEVTFEDALKILNISSATFYRKKKEFNL